MTRTVWVVTFQMILLIFYYSLPIALGAGLPVWGRVSASLATLLVKVHLGSVLSTAVPAPLCRGPRQLPAVSRNASTAS